MRIIGKGKLDEFARKYARARKSLSNWDKVVGAAGWNTSEEMKRPFNSVDYDEPRTIFNIAGNNLRLIALVDFKKQLVQVTAVTTHAEYDKERRK